MQVWYPCWRCGSTSASRKSASTARSSPLDLTVRCQRHPRPPRTKNRETRQALQSGHGCDRAHTPCGSLLIPIRRPVAQHLSQPQSLRLTSIEDSFHNLGCEASQRQKAAHVGDVDTLALRQVGDRLRLTAVDPALRPVRAHHRSNQHLVAARLRRRGLNDRAPVSRDREFSPSSMNVGRAR
jgi:hypothetical protein